MMDREMLRQVVDVIPEEKLVLAFALINTYCTKTPDDYESDQAYFESIPGFAEYLRNMMDAPDSEWLSEDEVEW